MELLAGTGELAAIGDRAALDALPDLALGSQVIIDPSGAAPFDARVDLVPGAA
jgi:hypothetical protein